MHDTYADETIDWQAVAEATYREGVDLRQELDSMARSEQERNRFTYLVGRTFDRCGGRHVFYLRQGFDGRPFLYIGY